MEPATIGVETVVFLVLVALVFDFLNGFHDAANSIATVVSTRVLKPYQAVLLAAFFNFAAVLVFQLKVATTIGRGVIEPAVVDHYVVFGALSGAIAWNLITWWYGIPSSSSHALIGGLVGAAVAKSGFWALIASGLGKILVFSGWRIVRTMRQRITKLRPVGGFCAETAGAMTLFLATEGGIPVSTTHTITGAITGVGATQSVSAVRWGIAGSIVVAWVLTIPASAAIAACALWLSRSLF
jgi:phosphate/sulfate permease